MHLDTFATAQYALVCFVGNPHYSSFKQIADQDRYRNEKVRCATVFSEKLRLRRRTAASSRDEALYTRDLGCFAQRGLQMFSATLSSPGHNEQEHEVDITKGQF